MYINLLLTYLYISYSSIYPILEYHYFVFGQIVSEYERAVMFRLGRALAGARGPGELNRMTPMVLSGKATVPRDDLGVVQCESCRHHS